MKPPFILYPQTPCFVRQVGTTRWQTTKLTSHVVCGAIKSWNDAETHAILEHDGLEYMVHRPFLEGPPRDHRRYDGKRSCANARKLNRFLRGGNRRKTRKRSRGKNGQSHD